ncbi:intraflagellar transport protein 122 homolog isoform X1 [Argiope bruennichi]|uniref:intraflagellar transport protein 122 homolog isoform X1 n=1 Tax=Argiope bruennichi TaxID=94029 RepID=UPI002494894F|nr:intraflagellar transport protein 122 homolog isoform X1 [Argiope bruennichi]
MRSVLVWEAQLLDKEEKQQCVYDIALKPDGSMVIIASGSKLLAYDTEGKLLQSLKGHSDTVYCVSFSKDGQRFASGGADKQVIIWTSKLEGILRYSHHDSIQCLAYNPVSDQLASCACSDFGLWSPEQKSVSKHRVNVRITSCSWTCDGMLLAVGLVNGCISIRGRNGDEKLKIERPGGIAAQVWGVCWSPIKDSSGDHVLAVVDWGQTLSFYNTTGKQVGRERGLGFDPLRVTYFSNGEYIIICGTNRKCSLYTKEGVFVGDICEQESWVWCCATKDDSTHVAIGTQDGIASYYEVGFSTVHSLYRERYAYRENMTDVVVQHLITDDKVVVKCRELVKKLAIYKKRLAIQMPERINIYEVSDDSSDMHYKIMQKINLKFDCTLLVVCAKHIVLCQEKILQCLSFEGVLEKEWMMESLIRYIKVIGGPPGKEGILVGLRNGQVVKIFVDNALPVHVLKINSSIRCLDLSAKRKKLAVVDDNSICSVYDLSNNSLLYQEPNANSVAWNNHNEDMLCFTGAGLINIKVENFNIQQQKFQGFVIGFCGAKVFCLHYNAISTIDIPLSASMYQYIEKKIFSKAYQVACLGVTDSDWRSLAEAAIQNLELEVARKGFIRIKDLMFLKLIKSLEARRKNENEYALLGDVYAYLGKFNLAANSYQKANAEGKALMMYIDLRMFDKAQEFLSTSDTQEKKALVLKKAEWAKSINEAKAAAEMYLSVGEVQKAVELAAENDWSEMLITISKKVDLTEQKTLSLIGHHLKRLHEYGAAAEIFHKVGDIPSLVEMNVEAKNWKEAFELAKQYPTYKENVYVPYANWLAENDRFVEAQKAFYTAGRQDEAVGVLEKLTRIAVNEKRFREAGYYYWILSMQTLRSSRDLNDPLDIQAAVKKFWDQQFAAEIYYVYSFIYNYLEEPFTLQHTETLFNMSRYLWLELVKIDFPGISKFRIFYAAAKQSSAMKAFKLARMAYQQANIYRIPERFRESVEIATMHVHAKPFTDSEEVLPMCYRCSTSNPLINKQGNICFNCKQPFVYSFISFEILPVVEFFLEDGIDDDEAYKLLARKPKLESNSTVMMDSNTQYLKIEDNDPFEDDTDIFTYDAATGEAGPLILNRKKLEMMNLSEVIICKWPHPLRTQYFKNVLPSVQIHKCIKCNKLFHSDDYELEILKKNCCPFCRVTVQELEGNDE